MQNNLKFFETIDISMKRIVIISLILFHPVLFSTFLGNNNDEALLIQKNQPLSKKVDSLKFNLEIEDVLNIISYPDLSNKTFQESTIAIVDSGINQSQINNYWINIDEIDKNGLDEDRNGYIDDVYGWDFVNNDALDFSDVYSDHATFIANIIQKVNPWAKIMNIRVLNEKNENKIFESFAYAILYAISFPETKIIQFSVDFTPLPFFNYPSILKWAFTKAYLSGVAIVSVSGNSGEFSISEPGNWGETIAVTSVENNSGDWEPAYYSNTGQNIDISVPGTNIISNGFNSSSLHLSGTSFSSAFVGGTLSLLQSISKNSLSPENLRKLVQSSANDLGDCNKFGAGLLNVSKMISNYELGSYENNSLRCEPSYSIPTVLPPKPTNDGFTNIPIWINLLVLPMITLIRKYNHKVKIKK